VSVSEPEPEPEPPETASATGGEWLEAVSDRLGREQAPLRRLTRARRGRMLEALSTLSRRARLTGGELDPEIISLLELIGVPLDSDGFVARELAAAIGESQAGGMDPDAVPQVLQAYIRAVGRIAAVESRVMLAALRSTSAEERAEAATRLLDIAVPASVRAFDVLHRAMLEDAMMESAEGIDGEDSDLDSLAIGMVDLVKSSFYLSEAKSEELEQLVDAIFTAGQMATSDRSAHVVKYVGDGAFLAGAEITGVADAALDMVARLESELPLQARGGISYGFVVQRAGDVFGLPVNISQALCKAARPGTILLSADAAALIGPERRGRLRRRRLPNPAFGTQDVATLRAPKSRR
jgi:class 3 adenylate cyclase